jgi:hypothetical protein
MGLWALVRLGLDGIYLLISSYLYWANHDCLRAQLREAEKVNKGRREDSPDLTKWAVSSCIKLMGRPRKPFCWDTPGNVPTRRPEISCWQCNVAAATYQLLLYFETYSFFVLYPLASSIRETHEKREQENLGAMMKVDILWASQIVATPLMRYSGIVEGPASRSIILTIDRNTVLDYKISLRSRVSAMVDLKFRNVPRIDISETYLSVPLSIVDDQSILDRM